MRHEGRSSPTGSVREVARLVGASLQNGRAECITAAEIRELIEAGEPVTIVDIRDSATYAFGHIDGAVNVPYVRFSEGLDLVPHADGLVVVACYVGFLSSGAAQRLLDKGHDTVASLKGGVQSWIDAGYPVVETAGQTQTPA